jgi:hypothetical protein
LFDVCRHCRSKSREGEGSSFTEIEITTGSQFVMSNNIEPSLSFQLVPTVPIGRMVSGGCWAFHLLDEQQVSTYPGVAFEKKFLVFRAGIGAAEPLL